MLVRHEVINADSSSFYLNVCFYEIIFLKIKNKCKDDDDEKKRAVVLCNQCVKSVKIAMNLILTLIFLPLILPSRQQQEDSLKHPFEYIGNYNSSTERSKEYFYSGDVHASWQKAAELCELFGMKFIKFDDAKEENNFREKFSTFFNGREFFVLVSANTSESGSTTNWNWISGDKINFDIKWGEGQPNADEECLSFDEADPLLYHDVNCEDKYPFLCHQEWIIKQIRVKV